MRPLSAFGRHVTTDTIHFIWKLPAEHNNLAIISSRGSIYRKQGWKPLSALGDAPNQQKNPGEITDTYYLYAVEFVASESYGKQHPEEGALWNKVAPTRV
jgi:hypothetical protein